MRRTVRGLAALALAGTLASCGLLGGSQPETPTAPATAVPATAAPTAAAADIPPDTPAAGEQPQLITGDFSFTNDIILVYYDQHAVALTDMYGFVTRDDEWKLPVESQVLGYMDIDEQRQRGTFRLSLPARPEGTLVDVDNDGTQDTGVQIFAVAYAPNLTASPFAVGDDYTKGWPSYLAATVNDPENKDEVTGGKLVIWAPDAEQQFPTGFGPDGLLFTPDDPAGPVPAGYTVVDLDQQPFGLSREREQQMTLYEPVDVAIKDYSQLSYTEAFAQMFDRVRTEYAFNGVAGKEPPWDALYAELAPRVAAAEQARDAGAFFAALSDFTAAFKDGHVNLSGGAAEAQIFTERTGGGYGFAIRELDDGRVIVVFVTPDGPAAQAGITVGAEVKAFNGAPIREAIGAVQPLGGPFSTDIALRYQQQRYLLRAPLGATASITYANPGQPEVTASLTSVAERDSFAVTSLFRDSDPNALPVEFAILDRGVGYIKINSYYDDLYLLIKLFERALETFEQNGLPGIIIDLRQNGGGAPIALAGYLTDEEIPLGQSEYYSEETGAFEPEGPPDKVEPFERQFRFDTIALLVSPACASACDVGAYGFSKVPGAIVVGHYPTAGVYAEVARGQFLLPEGMALQVPTGRTVLPDGSIFLEGTGVAPTLRVPITEETMLAEGDPVLEAAVNAILNQ